MLPIVFPLLRILPFVNRWNTDATPGSLGAVRPWSMNEDGWEFSGNCYIGAFRTALEKVAQDLSTKDCPVRCRFNPYETRAELYVPDGRVIADVRVTGECGIPCGMKVRTELPLGESVKKLFETASRNPENNRSLFLEFGALLSD